MSASTCFAYLCESTQALNLRGVEPELDGVLLQVGAAQPLLVGEQPIVVRPELPLFVGALSRFGRRPRVRMVRQRIFAIDESDAIAVGVEHLLEGRTDPLAERSLKVGELDDLDRRVRRAPRRAVRRHRHLLPRRVEHHAHGGLRSSASSMYCARTACIRSCVRKARIGCRTCSSDRALHARLVRLIPGGDLRVGDRRHLRRDFFLDQRGAIDPLRLAPPRRSASMAIDLVERGAARFVERLRQLRRRNSRPAARAPCRRLRPA